MSDSYAYQGAQDQSSNVTHWSALSFLIQQALAQISTASVVKIVKAPYDASGNTITPGSPVAIGYVDVQPLVNQLDGYGNATPHGTVYRLSYHRNQGGNGAFISDPVSGDIGKMIIGDRDSSVVRATNAQGNPGSGRKFDKADGTYFGQTQAGAPIQYFSFTANGLNITDKNGNVISSNGSGPLTITAPNGCVVNGVTISSSGDVIAKNGVSLENHVHSDAGGSGNSGPPVP